MDKKLEVKRVLIFTFFAYLISSVISVVFNNILGDPDAPNPYNSFAGFMMIGPAAANLITRALTKEGMSESRLKFNIKGNIKYYVSSVWVILFITFIIAIAFPLIYDGRLYTENVSEDIIYMILSMISSCVLLVCWYFGEEFGWRGYLYPKLEKLIGTGWTIVVGGIIWGVWHTPVLLNGHNFGKDLWLFPMSNIVLMCIVCILIGAFFNYITKMTDSVYPAVIAHALFNNIISSMSGILSSPELLGRMKSVQISYVMFIPLSIVGIASIFLLIRKDRAAASVK